MLLQCLLMMVYLSQAIDVQWFVVTKENVEDKIAEVENYTGTDFVIFGMTPQSYENMALSVLCRVI